MNKWVWSTTLGEDVYAAWEEWRVPHTELQLERVPLTTTSREVIYRWVLIVIKIYATHNGMRRLSV